MSKKPSSFNHKSNLPENIASRILDSAPLFVLLLDQHGNIQYSNNLLEDITGYTAEELLNKNWFDMFISPKEQSAIRNLFQQAITGKPTRGNINSILTKEKKEILVEWSDSVIQNDQHQEFLLAIGHDVTYKVNSQNELLAEKKKYQKRVETLFVGLQEADLEGKITFSNSMHTKILGYQEGELVGKNIWDIMKKPGKNELQEFFRMLVREKPEPTRLEGLALKKDGSIINVVMDWNYLYDDQESLTGTVSIMTDVTRQKQLEREHQVTENLFKEARTLTKTGTWVYSHESHNLNWSEEIFDLLEMEISNYPVSNESFLNKIHPDDLEQVGDAYKHALKNKEAYKIIYRMLFPDGRIKWVEELCNTIFSKNGQPTTSFGAIQDITEHIEAQQALTESEKRHAEILDAVYDGVWDWDLNTGEINLSPRWKNILGYQDDELENKESTFRELVHPEDKDLLSEAMRRHLEEYEPYEIELRIRHKQGHYLWALNRGNVVRDKNGKPVRMLGVTTDITEKKKAEIALKDSLERFDFLMATSPAVLFVVEASTPFRVTFITENVKNMLQCTKEEFMQEGFWLSKIHPDDLPQLDIQGKKLFEEGICLNEYRYRMPDGSYKWLSDTLKLVPGTKDSPDQMIGFMMDIDLRKKSEIELDNYRNHLEEEVARRTKSLEEASNAKSHFLSRISHELRTPMNAILGFSQVLSSEKLNQQAKAYVQDIQHAGDHLLQLINELLVLSSIETGSFEASLEPTCVADIIQRSVQITHAQFSNNGVEIKYDPDECLSYVNADPLRLQQCIVNLLDNAAKYCRPGDLTHIYCTKNDDTIRISVQDSGPGISQENMEKIFTPFERLDAERTNVDGTGLGLALTKQLCDLMNCTLGAESTEGKGTRFWIEIERADESSIKPVARILPPLKNPARVRHSLKILYVEDNQANIRVLQSMLKNESRYELSTIDNSQSVMAIVSETRPDIIILDIHLPGLDGYQVLEQLKSHTETRNIPVIALSADALPDQVEKGLASGFNNYLTKPLRQDVLLETLAAISAEVEKHTSTEM